MARTAYRLHDAFPGKVEASNLAKDLRQTEPGCLARMRKLAKPQDGGRLKYGVYVKKSCRL